MLRNDFKKFIVQRNWNPDPLAWEWACRLTEEQCAPYLKGTVLSYQQAKQRAERSRATGFPMDRMFTSKGAVYDNPATDLLIWTIIYHIMTEPDDFVRVYHKCSPKVEVRPLDKLVGDNPKQRVFMCCEIVFYTIGIMLYGDQNDSFLRAWSDPNNYSCVGASLQYGMWHKVYTILTNNNDFEQAMKLVFHSFDISAMEATLRYHVFKAIYDMRFNHLVIPPQLKRYYTNLHKWFLSILLTAFIICPDGFLIIMFGGNPSGGFNTLTDNGFAQMLYKNYSLAKHSKDYDSLKSYAKKIRIKMVGDDSIESDHPYIVYYIPDCLDLGATVKYECDPGPITTQKFMNFSWIWDPRKHIMLPKGNLQKMLANIFYHRKRNSWRLTYAKLQAIRFFTQVYPDLDYQIMFYLQHIEKYHLQAMKDEKIDDVITYNATLSTNLTRKKLDFLLYGVCAEILGSQDK